MTTPLALPTVFLVDDHDVARAGARSFLAGRYEVVGEADEVRAAVELIAERRPDVVLLDVHLPGGGGAGVMKALGPAHPEITWVAFTVSTARTDVQTMLAAGVDGYLTKATFGADLPDLLDQARAGERPVSSDVAGFMLDIDEAVSTSPFERLTSKEREVVTYVARGYTYREAAAQLFISPKTLETHMHHIFEKLGVASRHQIAAIAYESGFVGPQRE